MLLCFLHHVHALKYKIKKCLFIYKGLFDVPTITGIPTSTVETGSKVVMSCDTANVKSGTILNYTFLHNGNVVQEKSTNKTYTIPVVQTIHGGNYTCEASSESISKSSLSTDLNGKGTDFILNLN